MVGLFEYDEKNPVTSFVFYAIIFHIVLYAIRTAINVWTGFEFNIFLFYVIVFLLAYAAVEREKGKWLAKKAKEKPK